MNQLHQGADYVEGFRYTDRYRNLISLLQVSSSSCYLSPGDPFMLLIIILCIEMQGDYLFHVPPLDI